MNLTICKGVYNIQYHFTPSEMDKVMTEHFTILVDTAEKKNQHITDYFDERKIKWKKKALNTGDYTLLITACPELGINQDWYFSDELCIERKSGLDEIIGNFNSSSKDGDRVFKEFSRMTGINRNFLIIEDNSIDDIIEGKYASSRAPSAVLRSILTWQARTGFCPLFVNKQNMGKIIYELCLNTLNYHLVK